MQHTTDILIANEGTRNNSDDNNRKYGGFNSYLSTI